MVEHTPKNCRLVFMGTPEFAVGALHALVQGGYRVVAVVTAPDKPAGRGLQLQPSAVKQYAVSHGLPVLQPAKLRDEAFLAQLRSFRADLFVVVAFRMLPEAVWGLPPLGTFNLHASLLPAYRGAAPINWAIMNGETETGVTTFFINEGMDAGKILLQERVPISPADTAGTLHDKLKAVGSRLVPATVDGVVSGAITAAAQESLGDAGCLLPAPKLFKENTRLDWRLPAHRLASVVRGLSPYPAAWCAPVVNGAPAMLKVFAAHAEECPAGAVPAGAVLTDGATFLKVSCSGGYLCIDELQLTGKKRMPTAAFLRGFRGTISMEP